VRLIRLDSGDTVADLAAVPAEDDEPGEGGDGKGSKAPVNGLDQKQIDLFAEPKGKSSARNAKVSPPAKKGKRRS
jgi:hypothetical protein